MTSAPPAAPPVAPPVAPDVHVHAGVAPAWHTFGPVLAAATAVALVAWRDPHVPGLWPTCPWLALTGTACPACGAMRGLERLAHGDVVGAVGHNALLLPTLVVLGWGWLAWAVDRHRGRHPGRLSGPLPVLARVPGLPRHPWVRVGAVVLVAAFWVARNLPGLAVLGPG